MLAELMSIWRAGGTAGTGNGGANTAVGAAAAGCLDAGRAGRLGDRVGVGWLRRGRRLRTRHRGGPNRDGAAGTLRGQRRRRLRGRPDLWRHASTSSSSPVSQTSFPELDAVADDIDAHRPVAVATVIAHPDAQWVGRRLIVRPDTATGSLGSARADAAVTDDARGLLAVGRSRGPQIRTRRAASRRRHGGLRVQLRPAPADAGVRRDRLRRRPGAAGIVPRLPGHGLRRPPGVRHPRALSHGRRGGRRLAPSVSGRPGGGGRHRSAHGDLRAHPRSEIRRPGARGGAAPAPGRLRGRDGIAPNPRRPDRAGCGRRG